MPIIQDRDVKFSYKRYRYYLQAFKAKAIVSQWFHRCTTIGVLCGNKTAQVRILACFFFFFFLSVFFFFLSVYVWKGFVHFLYIVAKSPSAFPK